MDGSPHKILSVITKVQVRVSLVNEWALSSDANKKLSDAGEKKLTVTRKNRYTQLPEKYKTERKNKYRSTERLRLLDIWCRLRGSGHGHIIWDHKKKIKELASFCECGITKLKESIKKLSDMGWLYVDDACIAITSERKVYGLCGLDFERKTDSIYVKPDKIKDEKQSHYWLYVASIADNRSRQAFAFTKAVLNTSDINARIWIKTYLHKQGHDDPDKIMGTPSKITAIMKSVYLDSFTRYQEDEIHNFLVENRPDVNRSVYGMAEAWNSTPQTVSGIKKQIRNRALAEIQKLGTISSEHRARNSACHRISLDGTERVKGTLWNKKTQETFQAICDDIIPRVPEIPLGQREMLYFERLVKDALEGRAAA